jgi:hypothetical protein
MKASRFLLPASLLAGLLTITIEPVLFQSFGAGPRGTVYSFSVPKPGATPANAIYYCWLPESVGTVRCVLVHQHGCTRGGDASLMMNDVQWLSFAKKWHAVFIAPDWPGGDCTWRMASSGSPLAFLMALDTLARKSNHPEIKSVPWALWGHSGGAQWITDVARTYAARIAVMVSQAGSQEMSTFPATLKVPILDHNSVKDMTIYFDNGAVFAHGRALGAVWAHMVNPFPLWESAPTAYDANMEGHAPHDLRMLAIPWMDICLAARLPDKPGDSVCKVMDTSTAWLGDTLTHAIAPAKQFTGNKLIASWLPNAFFALKWAEYMTKGTIYDSTPPPAPYNLAGTYANKQVMLKWDADADLETGIKTFIIYRNGSIFQTIQWPNAPTTLFTLAKGFQRWDDGDQPNPSPAPNMTFTDANANDTGTYMYQVSTVNWSDVPGPKSAPLTLKRGIITGAGTVSKRSESVPHSSLVRCNTMGGNSLNLFPGMVSVYDIRGRLLKSVEIRNQVTTNVKSLLGNSSMNVFLVTTGTE